MKKILVFLIFLGGVLNAYSQEFNVDDQVFKGFSLGEKIYVLKKPGDHFFKKSLIGKDDVNCEQIDEYIDYIMPNLEECIRKGPDSSRCHSIEFHFIDIVFYSHRVLGKSEFAWDLEKENNEVNSSLVTSMSSKKFQVKESKIRFLDESEVKVEEITPRFKEGSRMELFQNVYPVSKYLSIRNGELKANNRILLCDLRDGLIDLDIQGVFKFGHVEKVTSTVRYKSYEVYKEIKGLDLHDYESKVVQAAYLGYHMGKKLFSGPQIDGLSIKNLFEKLVQVEEYDLLVKEFLDQKDFEASLYPDKDFEKIVRESFQVRGR